MTPAVTIRNPGLMTLIVDLGRNGYSNVGVPTSAALDGFACRALYALLDSPDAAVLEVTGPRFALQFHDDTVCAITGARVQAFLDDTPLRPWTSFLAGSGSILRIREVREGFRYYIGFGGGIGIEKVMGSYATNLECRFGGWQGRPLAGGDILALTPAGNTATRSFQEDMIPDMSSPHRLRVISGPESDFFTPPSLSAFWGKGDPEFFTVSTNINRTGIRLEGNPLHFQEEAPRSIISEGILPGTIQVPGDGLPIIMLHERTIGGYARAATVARVDRDRLAHLRPGDLVGFELISLEEATARWRERKKTMDDFPALCR